MGRLPPPAERGLSSGDRLPVSRCSYSPSSTAPRESISSTVVSVRRSRTFPGPQLREEGRLRAYEWQHGSQSSTRKPLGSSQQPDWNPPVALLLQQVRKWGTEELSHLSQVTQREGVGRSRPRSLLASWGPAEEGVVGQLGPSLRPSCSPRKPQDLPLVLSSTPGTSKGE